MGGREECVHEGSGREQCEWEGGKSVHEGSGRELRGVGGNSVRGRGRQGRVCT